MTYSGQNVLIGSLLSIFGVTTWVLPYENFAPNEPSWIVSTIWFWYLLFPYILPRIQRWSDEQLSRSNIEYFWLQIMLAVLIMIGFGGFAGSCVSLNIYAYFVGNYRCDVPRQRMTRNIDSVSQYL